MSTIFEGSLADRGTWTLDHCSIAMAIDAVGPRSSMLILREALFGTTRFEDFVRRTKSTDAVVASRLKQLVDSGLLARQPYQEPGQRTRDEYLLTDKGRDLLPAIFALMQWGNKYLQEDDGPFQMIERGTGEAVEIGAHRAGAGIPLDDLALVGHPDKSI
jgi:DNA-binding HxlR family transcriptional regulator